MKKQVTILFLFFVFAINAQTNPIITQWLQNTSDFDSYYDPSAATQPTILSFGVLAGCQVVQYDDTYVYVTTRGLPFYTTGIFTGDGNTTLANDQDAMYRLPLNPTENTGTKTATSIGNNGVFIDGVSMYDWQDTVQYDPNAENGICGGPIGRCPRSASGEWNRDAIPAEKDGFDCGKGHPAGTNYHHHQNPSPFKYDEPTSSTYSDICDIYDSDGLYIINKQEHSPLIGFAYDGFPVYGAYAYAKKDGTGGISRMKSSYQLINQTTRSNGPDVDAVIGTQTFFNGYFKEDYQYVANTTSEDYLDEHNGRFCITPEYPNGIYCYFATVNEDNSSAFPYMIGPTFYGNVVATKYGTSSTTVSGTTVYLPTLSITEFDIESENIYMYPNPAQDFVMIQLDFTKENLKIDLINELGQILKTSKILKGTTTIRFETDELYNGIYFVRISNGSKTKSHKIIINH